MNEEKEVYNFHILSSYEIILEFNKNFLKTKSLVKSFKTDQIKLILWVFFFFEVSNHINVNNS